MSSALPHARIEEWLRHESFLRKTLRGLLASEADVDDVLQTTWTRLLERPSLVPAEPRGWLTRVARNAALTGLRSRRRRASHEAEAVPGARSDSPADSAMRMEALQRVVGAILTLEEPYRSVVLLRYEQDLDVAELAQKLGRSEATVRSQLSRAHEQLRQKLDRDFGGRERWAVLAAPLALRSAGLAAPLVAAAALVALGATAGLWWWNARRVVPSVPALAMSPTPTAAMVPASLVTPPAAREPLVAPATLASAPRMSASLPPSTTSERHLPPIELLDQAYYEDHGRATYSLQFGLRDDPDNRLTHNDWDLLFSGGKFNVCTVVNDASLLADLGQVDPLALDPIHLAGRTIDTRATVYETHAYFVWLRDDDTDLAALVVVREHEAGKRCLLDWYATDGTGRAQGSLVDDGAGEPLVASLERLRRELRGTLPRLTQPEAVLQARMGAGGGNEHRVHLDGRLNRIGRLQKEPLDLAGELTTQEPSRAYLAGGVIPDGTLFVVTGATWSGRALGDSNGTGLLKLVVGGETLLEQGSTPEPLRGSWHGEITLAPGDEARTYLGIANSSAGEARLFGHFADAPGGSSWGENAGFLTTEAPVVPPEPTLAAPRAVLQARASHGGGNPVSVTLDGTTSLYVDRIEETPLDFRLPPGDHDDQLVHWLGGRVPEGQVFVVTQVTWWSATYDESSHSRVRLVVAGEELLLREGKGEPEAGSWSGRLLVTSGEESRTSLEVGYFAAADVTIAGHFEPAPR